MQMSQQMGFRKLILKDEKLYAYLFMNSIEMKHCYGHVTRGLLSDIGTIGIICYISSRYQNGTEE